MAFITPLTFQTKSPSTPALSCRPILPHHVPVRHSTLQRNVSPAMNRSERTFIAVKPDGMNRGLLGNIISRFEAKGYKLVAIKTTVPSKELAQTHYAALSSKPFFGPLVDFITSGPVCAMVWEGNDVVACARRMIGETDPLKSAPGTIRGDFGIDVGRNVIHGSDAVETAEREIGIWFTPSELTQWQPTASIWIYE